MNLAIFTKQYNLIPKLAKKHNIFKQDQHGINPINLAFFSLDHKLIDCLNLSLNSHKFDPNFHKNMMTKLIKWDLEPYLIEFLPVNPEITKDSHEIEFNYAECYNEISGFTPMAKSIITQDVFRIKELVNLGWSEDIDLYIVKKHRGHIKGFKDVLNKSFESQVRKLIE